MIHCNYPQAQDCTVPASWYVMGAYSGDMAVYVCDEHREWAQRTFAPYIEEAVRVQPSEGAFQRAYEHMKSTHRPGSHEWWEDLRAEAAKDEA